MTPPSAKDYAAQMVRAMYGAPRKVRRRSLVASEMESLLALAYDAGVLAQQRFAERGCVTEDLALNRLKGIEADKP